MQEQNPAYTSSDYFYANLFVLLAVQILRYFLLMNRACLSDAKEHEYVRHASSMWPLK